MRGFEVSDLQQRLLALFGEMELKALVVDRKVGNHAVSYVQVTDMKIDTILEARSPQSMPKGSFRT